MYFMESKFNQLPVNQPKVFSHLIVTVIRDNTKYEIPPRELVMGDVCFFNSGDYIPADIRITHCDRSLKINNSRVNGDMDFQKAQWKPARSAVCFLDMDDSNLLFEGAYIHYGGCTGIVIAIGDDTLLNWNNKRWTFREEVNKVIFPHLINHFFEQYFRVITIISCGVVILYVVIVFVYWDDLWVTVLIHVVTMIVCTLPIALVPVLCISIYVISKRLGDRNVRIKNLNAFVNALPKTDVICTDKTGTITTNEMTITHVYYDLKERDCDTFHPMEAIDGDFYHDSQRNCDFLKLVRCGALCNKIEFMDSSNNCMLPGNCTENGIMRFVCGHIAIEYKLSIPDYRELHPKLHEVPFVATTKWHLSIHEVNRNMLLQNEEKLDGIHDDKEKNALIQIKGAPERILLLCDRYYMNGVAIELADDIREEIINNVKSLGQRGERVVAFAELILDSNEYDINIKEPDIRDTHYETYIAWTDLIICGYLRCSYKEYIPTDVVLLINEHYGYSYNEDCVIINYYGHKCKIDILLQDENMGFGDCQIKHLLQYIETQMSVKRAYQRLTFGSRGILSTNATFYDLKIERGSLLYLFKGPYTFMHTTCTAHDCNWPMRKDSDEGLIFVGLYSLIDPPRKGVKQAIESIQNMEIKVIMTSGDHPITSTAIARRVGIINADSEVWKTGLPLHEPYGDDHLDLLSEYDAIEIPGWLLQQRLDGEDEPEQRKLWDEILSKNEIVFGRLYPMQHLKVVHELQDRGNTVCFIGDGVNNERAMNGSDIAIGLIHNDEKYLIADVSDIILMDDNYCSVLNCIMQSKLLINNLQKATQFILSSTIAKILPFFVYQFTNIPLVISPILILLITVFDGFLAMSFAFEVEEIYTSYNKKNNGKWMIWKLIRYSYLQTGILQFMAGMYAYLTVFNFYGYSPMEDTENMNVIESKGQTAYFAAIAFVQIINLISCKTNSDSLFYNGMANVWMNYGMILIFLLVLFVIYIPFMNILFGTNPLKFICLTPCVPYIILIFVLTEIRKAIIRKYKIKWI